MKTLEQMSKTGDRLNRIKKDWSRYAKETVEIEILDNEIYCFASEIACLRLYYKFRNSDKQSIKVEFSKNLGKWFFSLIKIN